MENIKDSDESSEKERLKMRIAVLEESVKSCELECKASREMALRLEAELDQERRKTVGSAAALDSLKVEMESLVVGRRGVESERQTLGESLEASRRVIEASRRETCCLEKQVEDLQTKVRAAEEKLQLFLEKVFSLLPGKSKSIILPSEREILQELDNLCNKTVPDMDSRLRHASEELEKQGGLQRSTLQKAQLAEQQVQDLREKLKRLEPELLAANTQRDRLQYIKQQYEEFLEQLSEMMKVISITVDLSIDVRLKLILSRAELLVRQEADALIESKRLTHSLQQKVKSQKNQLESKELHIQLLRKKIFDLEVEKKSRSVLSLEENDALIEVRKLKKKVDNLQEELRVTKLSNTELRTQLTHADELKKTCTHERDMKKSLLFVKHNLPTGSLLPLSCCAESHGTELDHAEEQAASACGEEGEGGEEHICRAKRRKPERTENNFTSSESLTQLSERQEVRIEQIV